MDGYTAAVVERTRNARRGLHTDLTGFDVRPDRWRRHSWLAVLMALAAAPGLAADDPAMRALEQDRLQRQQQQDQLRLKMQQYHREMQNPPADAAGRRAMEQLRADQLQRQQELQRDQQRELQGRPEPPGDDPGTREAKGRLAEQGAHRESEQQLRRHEWEMQQQTTKAAPRQERAAPVAPAK